MRAARLENLGMEFAGVAGRNKEVDDGSSVEKKVARAMRNRRAAQRSRVGARLKMQSLSEANDILTGTVKELNDENEALNLRILQLMEHSYGSGISTEQVLGTFDERG